jgi:hypothetical protein
VRTLSPRSDRARGFRLRPPALLIKMSESP